jgi:beta-lactamase class A
MAGCAALLTLPAEAAGMRDTTAALLELERRSGARIGVAAMDSSNSRRIFWREAERFIMCSTFKLSLAATVLARTDKGALALDELIHYDKPVLGVSPATTRNQARGMTIAELCEAAIIYSDNTAANVLLGQIGGPRAVTAFWRALGDRSSRLDDYEPKLNIPDGAHNTTTPAAMMGNLKAILLGKALSPGSRALLLGWLYANTTGAAMLRAGLPAGWRVGDKTGRWMGKTATDGATNDIAIITPPDRAPLLAVCYTMGGKGHADARPAIVADVGRILATAFA